MFSRFFLVLICTSGWALEPVVQPAQRSYQPINEIRKIFYQIPKVNEERSELGLQPVINLSIGQPHIPFQIGVLDPFIDYLESLKKMAPEQLALEMGYSHAGGVDETRRAISQFFSHAYPHVKGGFSPAEVMVANGATGALTNALKALIEEGDEVAVLAPYYAGYENQIKSCGGILVAIPWMPDRSRAELLDKYLASHPRIKMFIWCDPNNPFGTKAEREELVELNEVIAQYPNLILLHDEIYRDIIHEGNSLSLLDIAPELKNRSLIIRSLAKDILGAPAIRAGMISAPIDLMTPSGARVNLIELMCNEQLRDVTGVSILVQKMLVCAIEQKLSGKSEAWEKGMIQEYGENTQLVLNGIGQMGLQPLAIPKGAFYLMINASSLLGKKVPEKIGVIEGLQTKVGPILQNDVDIAAFLLHAAGVAVVPGIGFGTEYCSFRISCARPKEQLFEAMERMNQAIQSLYSSI